VRTWRGFKAAGAVLATLGLTMAPATGAQTVIAVLGDSLTAGFGLALEDAFPAQLEARLKRDGLAVRVVNAGVSGDTSAGGRARLDWVLADAPDMVIVELGANDALRGLAPAETEANLDAVLAVLTARGIAVLLTGMLAPPNLGADYGREFRAVFAVLAAKHAVAFYPFFLDGVAAQPALNQNDGIHPNAHGVAEIVARITPYVRRAIEPE
jgi:acyl-CoA thioesterase-1